ncbi:hypothetical protein KAT08_04535 [Candidatus Babeliales bacterium]|nr:hypothetical protein [Candidatus Babeliales bacterium]
MFYCKKRYFSIFSLFVLLGFCFISQNLNAEEASDFQLKKTSDIVSVVKDDIFKKNDKKLNEKVQLKLSSSDCNLIIEFLRQLRPEKTFLTDISFILKDILKEGVFVSGSVCSGLLVSYLLFSNNISQMFSALNPSNEKENLLGKGFLISGFSIILSYVAMKIIDKKLFNQKSKEDVIRDILYDIIEKRDHICLSEGLLKK